LEFYEENATSSDKFTAEQRADQAYDAVLGPEFRGMNGDWMRKQHKYKNRDEDGNPRLDENGQPLAEDVIEWMQQQELAGKSWNTGKFNNVVSRELNRIQNAIYILERKINALGKQKKTIALRTKLKQTRDKLLEKLAEEKGAEGILIYAQEALAQTEDAFSYLTKAIEDSNAGVRTIDAQNLQKIYDYIMAFNDIQELIDDIVAEKIDVSVEVIDILQEIHKKQQETKSLYTKYGIDLVANRFAENSDATKIIYEEEKRKEFLRDNKREKGESKEDYQRRLSEYVLEAVQRTEHLWQGDRAREHISRLLLSVSADISWVQRWLVDGNNTDSLLISIVNKEITLTEDRARLEYENIVDRVHKLWEQYRADMKKQGKTAGDSKSFYENILERDEDGNVTGYITSKFHSGWLVELQKRDEKFRELKKTKGEDAAKKFRKEWNKKNAEISSQLTPYEKKKYYALQAGAQKTGDWSHYNNFREKLEKRLAKTQDILFIPKGEMAEKYTSQQYKNIMELGPENTTYKLYKELNHLIQMSNEMLPPDYKRKNNKLLGRRKGLWERLQDVEQKWNPADWWTNFVAPWWEEKYKLTTEDVDFDVTTERMEGEKTVKVDQNEQVGEYIPIHYTGKIDMKDQSLDVMSDVLQGLWAAMNYKHMSQLLPYLEITRNMLKERPTQVSSGALDHISQVTGIGKVKQTKPGEESNEYQMLLDLIRDRVYGQRMIDYGDLPFGNISINKMIGFIGYYTGLQLLGLSWVSGMVNWNLAYTTATIEGLGNEFFNVKDFLYAQKEYGIDSPFIMNDIGKIQPTSKTNALGRKFDPLNDFRAVDSRYAYNTKVKQLAQSGAYFLFNHIGEHVIQNLAMYAVLHRAKLKNKDGQYVNAKGEVVDKRSQAAGFDKAYNNENGVLSLKDFVGSVETDTGGVFKQHRLRADFNIDKKTDKTLENEFVMKQTHLIQEINKRLHGAYSNRNKNMFQRTGFGVLAMAMRKYLSPSIVYRYHGIFGAFRWVYDYARGMDQSDNYWENGSQKRVNLMSESMTEGAYATSTKFFMKAMIDFLKQAKKMKFSLGSMTRENWRTMSKNEKANIVRTIGDLGFGIVMAILAGGYKDDDDHFMAYFAFRLHSELIMYVNPNEFMRIMASPAVSMTMLERIVNLITQLTNDAFNGDPEWERYKAGLRKGQTRISKRVRDIVPFYYQFERHKYMPDVVDYYYKNK
jgi:hypothetical protein